MIALFISIIVGATLIGIGVHFIPVGGAPAALSTTAGIPTGAPMITIGMGITGILVTSSVIGQSQLIVLLSGATSSMIMMAVTMLFSNIVHVYGVGVPISSQSFEKDPITGFSQENYVSPGTTGHGIPTVSFISGLFGALLGGLGGSLAYYSIFNHILIHSSITDNIGTIAAVFAVLLFFIIAVISSYNIGGTIQGFYDKKFKTKIVPGAISCFLVSVVLSIFYVIILGGI
ncbi:MAG: tetrahydromethanopterin S-methyltransferase subunit D [Methanosphaera stadtmanae]|jgi:tetrahydromethanopterin S-methyltransferase subunit D|nr:tetrahydromethanopterin S-methyltransferase subunit D [Methanosphaera stadtmanae]